MSFRSRVSFAVGLLLLVAVALHGQEQKPPEPPKPGSPQQPTQGQTTPQADDTSQARVFLTGSVVFEDGEPFGESVPVELVCQGQVTQQTTVGIQGRFTFQLGNSGPSQGVMDASVSGSRRFGSPTESSWGGFGSTSQRSRIARGRVDLGGCEIRLSQQAGFAAETILLAPRSILDNPDVGVLVVRRPNATGGSTVSLTTLSAPDKATKAFQNAKKELSRKKVDQAKVRKELEKAVSLYPDFAEAWRYLGLTCLELRDSTGARNAFTNAIRADENYSTPYLHLAQMELQDENWSEASQLTDTLLELSPEIPLGRYLNGLAKYNLGELGAAEQSFRSLEQDGYWRDFPMTYFFLGMIDSQRGEIPRAAEEYRNFLKTAPQQFAPPALREQLGRQLQSWEARGLIPANR